MDLNWVAHQTGQLFEKNNDLQEDDVGLRCELRNSKNVCMDLEERNRQLQHMVEELIMETTGSRSPSRSKVSTFKMPCFNTSRHADSNLRRLELL